MSEPSVDFDWAAVFRDCDGDQERDTQLADALGILMRWVVPIKGGNARGIATRMIALCWCVSPDIVGGGSLVEVARRFGVKHNTLEAYTGQIASKCGIRNTERIAHLRREKRAYFARSNDGASSRLTLCVGNADNKESFDGVEDEGHKPTPLNFCEK